jgi:hypothetical protein
MPITICHNTVEKVKITDEEYENALSDYEDRLEDDDGEDLLEIIAAYEDDEETEQTKTIKRTINLDFKYAADVLAPYWKKQIKKGWGYNFDGSTAYCEQKIVVGSYQTLNEFSDFLEKYQKNFKTRLATCINIWYLKKKERVEKFYRNAKVFTYWRNWKTIYRFIKIHHLHIIQGKMQYVNHEFGGFNREFTVDFESYQPSDYYRNHVPLDSSNSKFPTSILNPVVKGRKRI